MIYPHIAWLLSDVLLRLTNALVWLWWTGYKLEDLRPLFLKTPAMQDFTVALLKVIKLQCISWIEEPVDRQKMMSKKKSVNKSLVSKVTWCIGPSEAA